MKDKLKTFLLEVEYDYFAAMPAWNAKAFAYELFQETFVVLVSLVRVFISEEQAKELKQELQSIMEQVKNTEEIMATGVDLYYDLESLDLQFKDMFEKVYEMLSKLDAT